MNDGLRIMRLNYSFLPAVLGLLVTLACVRILTSRIRAMANTAPQFYNGYAMPRYEIDPSSEGKEYEKRYYEPEAWVATRIQHQSMDNFRRTAFRRLFRYISGENDSKQPIKMTVPVLMDEQAAPGGNSCGMAFYVPGEHQADPPAPSSPEVNIDRKEPMTVYATTYSGYSNETKWKRQCEKLKGLLEKDNISTENGRFVFAAYDSPYRFLFRRNEAWFIENPK